MKIGILRCGHTPDEVAATHGQYEDMFARLLADEGLEFRTYGPWSTWRFPKARRTPRAGSSPGRATAPMTTCPGSPRSRTSSARSCAAGRPLVGICFGHQIIAQALGGTVVKFPAAGGGAHRIRLDGETSGLNAWHQDQVIAPPEGARGDRPDAPLRLCRAALSGTDPDRAAASRVFDAEIVER
jgi:GMP synthase-like glutamine amidotransferase